MLERRVAPSSMPLSASNQAMTKSALNRTESWKELKMAQHLRMVIGVPNSVTLCDHRKVVSVYRGCIRCWPWSGPGVGRYHFRYRQQLVQLSSSLHLAFLFTIHPYSIISIRLNCERENRTLQYGDYKSWFPSSSEGGEECHPRWLSYQLLRGIHDEIGLRTGLSCVHAKGLLRSKLHGGTRSKYRFTRK